jgi:hypothetical protein
MNTHGSMPETIAAQSAHRRDQTGQPEARNDADRPGS